MTIGLNPKRRINNQRQQEDLQGFVPESPQDMWLTGNYMKVPNTFVDVLLPNVSPKVFRLVMYVWRNTYGRRDQGKRTKRDLNWEQVSYRQMGTNFGLKGADAKSRGRDRNSVMRDFQWAVHEGILVAERDAKQRTAKAANWFSPGPEIWNLINTGDFSPEFRERNNVSTPPGQPSFKGQYVKPDDISQGVWSFLATQNFAGWALKECRIKNLKRSEMTVVGWHEFTGKFFFMPLSFEDLIAPNVPTNLYPLLVKVWRNTYGRLNMTYVKDEVVDTAAKLSFDKMSYGDISELFGVSTSTAKRVVQWGRRNDIIEVINSYSKKAGDKANSYWIGSQVWYVIHTGDFTTDYRTRHRVMTKASHPAIYDAEEALRNNPKALAKEIGIQRAVADMSDESREERRKERLDAKWELRRVLDAESDDDDAA